MSPSDILNCIHWIQEYRESMEALGVDTESESSSSAMLLEHVPTLMQAYLTSVRQTMSDWAQKIMQTDWRSEPSEDNGRWSTSAPQDLFVILNQQIDLAVKREIKGQPFLDIVTMCLSVLGDYQALLISALNAQGADRPDNYLCAILSNCQQCSENCEAMRDRCREQLEPEMEGMPPALLHVDDLNGCAEILEEKTDDAINGFIRVGTVAVNVLASQMVACIKEKVRFWELLPMPRQSLSCPRFFRKCSSQDGFQRAMVKSAIRLLPLYRTISATTKPGLETTSSSPD